MKRALGAVCTILLSAGSVLAQTDYSNQLPYQNAVRRAHDGADSRPSAQLRRTNGQEEPLPRFKEAFFNFFSLDKPEEEPVILPAFKLSLDRPAGEPGCNSEKSEVKEPLCEFTRTCPKERIWGSGEYLLWWIKSGSTPPLVSLGDPSDPFPGSLGQPGTQVIYGGNGALDYGTFSGLRATLGGWLDADGVLGVEGNGFLLERRPIRFVAGSDSSGNPPIFLPIFRPDLGREGGFTISSPVILNPSPQFGFFTGTVTVASSSQLWGAGADVVGNLFRTPAWSLDLLGGFRYLDLLEGLTILGTGLGDFPSGVENSFIDQFNTCNQYYGGEFGGRLGYRSGRLSLDAVAKVALGINHEVVNINGSFTQVGAALGSAQGTFPGGVFTQTSNNGRRVHDPFAVVPQVQVKAGYAILPRLTATVGYDFLYWSQVVRPGNQIDHSVNLTQSLTQGGGSLVGPSNPAPLFNHTDFFAHGISFGLELKY